jgi:hypothetical protein
VSLRLIAGIDVGYWKEACHLNVEAMSKSDASEVSSIDVPVTAAESGAASLHLLLHFVLAR